MPETFLISPSEAMLLGLCLEEYLCYQSKHESERRRFLEILESRLMPHVKSLRQLQTPEIGPEFRPADIEWSGMFGRSKSSPGIVFATNDEGNTYAIQFDLSRRSLLDRLIGDIWDHLSRTHYDSYLHAPTKVESAAAIFELYTRSDLWAAPPRGSESTTNIREFIEALVSANECDHVFDVGRRFGRVVYSIDDFESFVWSIDKNREQLIEETRGEIACEEMIIIDQDAEIGAQKEFEEWLSSNLKSLVENRPPDMSEEEWSEVVQRKIENAKNAIFEKYSDWALEQASNYEPPAPDAALSENLASGN